MVDLSIHRSSAVAALVSVVFGLCGTAAIAQSFTDVTAQRGLDYSGETYGASWGDANGDGRPDLWLGNKAAPGVLYLSEANGGFVQAPPFTGLQATEMFGASWADADNDGDQDLLVVSGALGGGGSEPNQLFVNDGGSFTEQGGALGIDYPLGRGRHATWFDWNNDGFLDVALINDNKRNTAPHFPSAVFTWDVASGTYVQEAFDINTKRTTGFAQLAVSNDAAPGSQVLLVHHDKVGFPDGVLTFSPAGATNLRPTFAFPAIEKVFDVATADFDNDLSMDWFTVSRTEGRLLLQKAAGIDDTSAEAGLSGIDKARFVVAADFDNDKDVDLYIARADLGLGTNLPNLFFANQGDGTFVQQATAEGTSLGLVSGLAAADYNADGFVDLLITNSEGGVEAPVELLENAGNTNNWMQIDLVGTLSNRDAVGAVVRVVSGGTTQLREVSGGIHDRSQNDKLIHVGLGTDTLVDSIEITWPSGIVQVLTGIEPNQRLTVVEAAPSSPNADPLAVLALTRGEGTRVDVSALGSSDVDGAVVMHSWDFGDGTSGSGLTTSHSYALQGSYTITLTVTDDRGATGVASTEVDIQLTSTVNAVGANPDAGPRLVDVNSDGSQDLDTFWRNFMDPGAGWFTIDLGEPRPISAVLLALRGNVEQVVEIYVGNALDMGQVTGFADSLCSFAGTSARKPTALTSCAIDPQLAQYITVRSRTNEIFEVYGVDISEDISALPVFKSVGFSAKVEGDSVLVVASEQTSAANVQLQYLWDFGDATTQTGSEASHTYAVPGTYTIGLTVSDSSAASVSVEAEVTVAAVAESGQLSATVHAVGSTASTQGNLLDTLSGGQQNLSTRWLNSNNQQASAWFTLDLASSSIPSEILLAPRGDLKYTLDIFVGDEVADGRVVGNALTRCIIPAGSTLVPAGLTTCPLPAAQGRYITVAEAVRSKLLMYGLEIYGSEAIETSAAPSAYFGVQQVLNTLQVDFDGSASADTDGDLIDHVWNFGDGTMGSGVGTSHTYAQGSEAAPVFASLAVTDNTGNVGVFGKTITVAELPVLPVFMTQPVSATVIAGLSHTFSAQVDGSAPMTLQWLANGTVIAGATGSSVTVDSVTLADDGAQYALEASNSAGTVNSEVAVLSVVPDNLPPVAEFTFDPMGGFNPVTINFDAAGSTDSDGSIASYSWTFGDGGTASGVTAAHEFLGAGDFVVTLTVVDNDGATSATSSTITVDQSSEVVITAQPQDQAVLSGADVTFTVAVSSTPPLAYQWRENGTDIVGATGASFVLPAVSLADDGRSFDVVITNQANSTTSQVATLQVNELPVPVFNLSTVNGTLPFTLSVDASASTDNGSIVSYEWTFGDGGSASGVSATHDYTTSGSFVVTLTVTDDRGATATLSQTVIANTAPTAGFTASPLVSLAPSLVDFDGSASTDSDGSVDSYGWNFGDGAMASGSSSQHTYTVPGNYDVTLTVTDNNGATNTTTQNIVANDAPIASISLDIDSGIIPIEVVASAANSTDAIGGIVGYAWDFGDGTSAAGLTASHSYSVAGEYTITLTVTDSFGEATTTTTLFSALPPLPPVFVSQPQSQNILEGQAVVFSAAVTGTAPFAYQWTRNGIDVPGATGSSFTYAPVALSDEGAAFAVRVTNAASTVTSTAATLVVTPLNIDPVPSFTAGQVGNTLSVAFDGTGSTDVDGSIVSYAWTFGDGASSSEAAPVHTYSVAGSYLVTLVVVDDAGASASASQTLDVQISTPVISVVAAGANTSLADRAIDRLADGSLDLSTYWVNDHAKPTAWMTFDLGSSQAVGTLLLAPRADREYTFDVFIGDQLDNGRVPGVADATCVTPDLARVAPIELQECSFAGVQGRYVTVASKLVASLRLYGIEISSGVGNLAPIAEFSVSPLAGSGGLGFEFDASATSDPDGQVVLYNWTFGDGSTATGQSVQHSYAAAGEYAVMLSAVDNSGDAGVVGVDVTAGSPPTLARADLIVTGAGSRASLASRAADRLENTEQNLSSHWTSGSNVSKAWITVDLAQSEVIAELLYTVRKDRDYTLDVHVGDVLVGGRVQGAASVTCNSENTGVSRPTELATCAVPDAMGRYLTLASTNRAGLRVFGLEVYVHAEPSGDPNAAFSAEQDSVGSLLVNFDAAASSDPDGVLVSFSWDFGDGTTGSGSSVSHSYATAGDYEVTLLVTDDSGLTATASVNIFAGEAPNDVPVQLSVFAAGFNADTAGRIVDVDTAGEQNLSSFWKDGGRLNKSWFTLDLGSSRSLTQLSLAPRNDRNYTLQISVGDVLDENGEVVGGTITTCDFTSRGVRTPSALSVCASASGTGQYITVRNLSGTSLHVYGAAALVAN